MNGSSVWTAASLAPMTTRPRRTCWSSRTACSASDASRISRIGVVLQQPAGLGQRAGPGRPVEEPLPQLLLEPADALADRRLGPVQLLRRRREAPLRRDGEKRAEVLELHGPSAVQTLV